MVGNVGRSRSVGPRTPNQLKSARQLERPAIGSGIYICAGSDSTRPHTHILLAAYSNKCCASCYDGVRRQRRVIEAITHTSEPKILRKHRGVVVGRRRRRRVPDSQRRTAVKIHHCFRGVYVNNCMFAIVVVVVVRTRAPQRRKRRTNRIASSSAFCHRRHRAHTHTRSSCTHILLLLFIV